MVAKGGRRVRSLKKTEIVAGQLNFAPVRELTVELELAPGQALTVFPSTLKPGTESEFTLSVFCKEKVEFKRLSTKQAYD